MSDTLSAQRWWHDFADGCQRCIGANDKTAALHDLRDLLECLPADLGAPARILTVILIAQITTAGTAEDPIDATRLPLDLIVWGCTRWPAREFRSGILTFLDVVKNLNGGKPASGCRDPRINTVLQFVSTRYAEPGLSLRHLAGSVGLSPWHLSRALKEQTGVGLMELLRTTRVVAATRLLSNPHLSIKEIAARTGYNSTAAMDRHFKYIYGVPPSAKRPAAPECCVGAGLKRTCGV
jgi:AraC-like DNA-binding protein